MAFCTQCGRRVEDDWNVCIYCGSAIETHQADGQQSASQQQVTQQLEPQQPAAQQPIAAQPAAQQYVAAQPASQQPASPSRNAKLVPVIVGACIAVVIVIVVCVMFALHLGPFSAATNSAEGTAQQIASTENSSNTNATAETAANNSSQSSTPENSTPVEGSNLSIANADDCYKVNIFLSNFTEKNTLNFQAGTWTTDQYANWAYEHCVYNNSSCVEQKSSSWPSAATKASLNVRVSGETIAHYVSVFFKVDIDPSQCSKYLYLSGYNYFNSQQPDFPKGVAHATAITYLGNGRYQVEYEHYGFTGCMYNYDVLDESLYSASAAELMARFDTKAPLYTGTAVIEEGYDGIAPFKLISMSEK